MTKPFDPNEIDFDPDDTKGVGVSAVELYGFVKRHASATLFSVVCCRCLKEHAHTLTARTASEILPHRPQRLAASGYAPLLVLIGRFSRAGAAPVVPKLDQLGEHAAELKETIHHARAVPLELRGRAQHNHRPVCCPLHLQAPWLDDRFRVLGLQRLQ